MGNQEVKKYLLKHHADLFEPELWLDKQKNLRNEVFEDVFPYPNKFRLNRS